jgi:two-component system, response regulator YesN
MIVDDEEPVLESFSYILKKGIPDFELCGMARSGTEAIELVPGLKPDLIFMDIQMPGSDGIETITNIQKRFPNIIFILASAYERFDIAQKAIPLGVFNYLVKPVSRKALADEFVRVKAQLDGMHEKNNLQLEEAHYARKMRHEEEKRFLLGLAWTSPGEREWREFTRLFSVKGDQGAIMLFKVANPLAESEIENVYQALIHQLKYKTNCLSAILAGQMILFFHENEEIEKIEKYIENALESIGKIEYRFGFGKYSHYSSLNESYREAFDQLRTLEGKVTSAMEQRKDIRDLCEKFLFSEWAEVQPLYEKHWMHVFMSNDFLVAKAKMIAFFVYLMNELDKDLKIDCNIDMDPAEEIIGLSSVEKWQQWSSYMMDRLRFIIKENKDQYYPKPLSVAVNFIKDNYTKPLQLSQVAEKCEISQGYLSRLFSEYLNTTFIDYLNTRRINEAARLLRQEKKTVKEVSYMVGFSDPNYFSRIFKRYMNASPSELTKGGPNDEE